MQLHCLVLQVANLRGSQAQLMIEYVQLPHLHLLLSLPLSWHQQRGPVVTEGL